MKISQSTDSRWSVGICSVILAAFLLAGCGGNGDAREAAKIEASIAEKQATVVAMQSEIAGMKATVTTLKGKISMATETADAPRSEVVEGAPKTVRTKNATAMPTTMTTRSEAIQPTATARPAVTPTPVSYRVRFFVTDMTVEDEGNGWARYNFDLSVLNDGDRTIKHREIPSWSYIVMTDQGFTYQGNLSAHVALDDVPPHFAVSYARNTQNNRETWPAFTMDVRVASSSTPLTITFESPFIAPISLQLRPLVKYPTNITDGVPILPVTITSEDVGEITFAQSELGHSYRNVWTLFINGQYQNLNRGYGTSAEVLCNLYQSDGGLMLGSEGTLVSAGPATTHEFMTYISVVTKPEATVEDMVHQLTDALIICAVEISDYDGSVDESSFIAKLPIPAVHE